MNSCFFNVKNITCFHGGEKILDSISFKINRGEFVVLFGNNGSGKSTLVKHLNGLYLPDLGDVYVDNINTKDLKYSYEIKRKVSLCFQNPDHQIICDKIKEDVSFGPENIGVPLEEIKKKVNDSLKFVNLYDYKNDYINTLSGGAKQRLVIAGSLAIDSEALILDEPASMLDYKNKKDIINNLLKLNKEKKLTIILLTHDIDDLNLTNRVIILDNGKISSDINDGNYLKTNFFINNRLKCKLNILKNKTKNNKNEIITFKNVSYKYDNSEKLILNNINLKIYENEIIGIMGESSSGKTTFVNLIKGILKPRYGNIFLKNEKMNNCTFSKIGILFQYPEKQIFEETVIRDAMFGPINLGIQERQAYELAKDLLIKLGIEEDKFNISPFELSGGEIRKLSIVSILTMKPEILILDEPTAGLDYFSRRIFLDLIINLNSKVNNTIILISHSIEDLMSVCNRILKIENSNVKFIC